MKFYLPDVAKAGVPQGIKTRFMHRLKKLLQRAERKISKFLRLSIKVLDRNPDKQKPLSKGALIFC